MFSTGPKALTSQMTEPASSHVKIQRAERETQIWSFISKYISDNVRVNQYLTI